MSEAYSGFLTKGLCSPSEHLSTSQDCPIAALSIQAELYVAYQHHDHANCRALWD